jgi:hypothetical protein
VFPPVFVWLSTLLASIAVDNRDLKILNYRELGTRCALLVLEFLLCECAQI